MKKKKKTEIQRELATPAPAPPKASYRPKQLQKLDIKKDKRKHIWENHQSHQRSLQNNVIYSPPGVVSHPGS